jgi:SAM-dependent methyltransferase
MSSAKFSLVPTPCAICGKEEDYDVVFPENFQESDFNEKVFSARRLPDRLHYRIVRCRHDGLLRSNPVLPAEEAYRLYRKSTMNYDQETGPLAKTYMEALERALNDLNKDARILEIGCGNGFVLKAIQERGFLDVHGVEPSSDAVAKADPDLRGRIVHDIFRPGLFPAGAGSFDLVCSFQTLDHIYDPNAFLSECCHLLRPGGILVAFQHDAESWSARLLGEKSPIVDVEHIYLFSASTLRKIFEKNGFQAQQIFSPRNVLTLKHLLWLTPLPFKWKQARLERASRPGSILNKTIRLPLGNLCIIAVKK